MQTLSIHLDLFALVMLLGIAQGLFLGFFFLTGARGRNVANRCLGWLMLGVSAIMSEMWLEYTNYMFRTLVLVDVAEPFNFLLGPLFFLFVYCRINRQLPTSWGWHLVPFIIWSVNAVTWMYQPDTFKYNSYIDAWHPELPFIPTKHYFNDDFTGLRDYINELTMVSCAIYFVCSLVLVYRAYERSGRSFWYRATPDSPGADLGQLRNLSVMNAFIPVLILVVKLQYHEDVGDYILACYITLTIYATSFLVMRGSTFFAAQPMPEPTVPDTLPEPKKKYEKSSLSEEVEEAVLQKLTRLMESEKPYLQSDLSLPKLAAQLNTTPHHLSQLINDRLAQSFFDLLAQYRIGEARQLLQHPATANLKIDEIAERVGYNSTSAFHTAFKRITGQTPAQYRQLPASR